jgi:nicotinamide riboside transporter PnuC
MHLMLTQQDLLLMKIIQYFYSLLNNYLYLEISLNDKFLTTANIKLIIITKVSDVD